uniref:Putative HTH-type transcriptional regulatory protein ENV17_04695 n=1 Tax=Thermofilum pendens TaxID=2269 RepID=A0A7C4B9N2_THEPE
MSAVKRIELKPKRYCADEVILHNKAGIILTKNIEDAAHLPRSIGGELKAMSDFLEATPLITAESMYGEKLEEGVVYSKHGIAVVSKKTFERLISEDHREPFIYVHRGGIYVKVRGDVLRRLREERKLSRGELAEKLGVTPRMVANYEENLCDVTLEVAVRLESLLGDEVFEKLSLKAITKIFSGSRPREEMSPRDEYLRILLSNLEKLGFKSYAFSRAPIDAGLKGSSDRSRAAIKKHGRDTEPQELELAATVSDETGTKLIVITDAKEDLGVVDEYLAIPRGEVGDVSRKIVSYLSGLG